MRLNYVECLGIFGWRTLLITNYSQWFQIKLLEHLQWWTFVLSDLPKVSIILITNYYALLLLHDLIFAGIIQEALVISINILLSRSY